MTRLTPEIAERFATAALGHVRREYPHKLDHVLGADEDALPPRVLHPIFHGSFDWHSCVHGYWALAVLLRRTPEIATAPAIRALFDHAFTAANVEAERAYLDHPTARGFERPYGWAWLLKLHAELARHDTPWAATLRPLARAFAERLRAFLPLATYPVRTGTHFNTAFALRLALDWADDQDRQLAELARTTALRWYAADADCQAWEPSGDDFLSSALMQAECVRRVLEPEAFRPWFAAFLPRAASGEPATLFTPATVSDRGDGKIAHLDGLNLSRAWCWRALAADLAPSDPVRAVALDAADRHLAVALPHVTGDYMGEHWLASFALLALEA